MAAALVGESLLSSFFSFLLDRIATKEVVDFFKRRKLDEGQLRKLKTALRSVNKLLDDAEEKQIADKYVKEWLNELKDVVYEVDDLLDEIAYEAWRSEFKPDDSQAAGTSKVKKIVAFLSPSTSRRLSNEESDLVVRLENILATIRDLMEEKVSLGLMEGSGQRPFLQLERRTTSLVDESIVYGRDADKETIIRMLISDECDNRTIVGLMVIPIVGMGGVGKTTLAQLVYRDDRVKAWFQLQVWVCVSEEFDVFKVTRNILKELAPRDMSIDGLTPNLLHIELEKKLEGQRFLLVLDDIWEESHTTWDTLKLAFKSGAQGSKIIVTTRSRTVATIVSSTEPYLLKVLNDDQCWSLFARKALGEENFSGYPELQPIGRQIVEKCKGLPLAANSLGCLLSNERNARKWERILKSNIWDIENDNILPALKLSYHYLPSNLKRCFAYCAIIPKDYHFKKEKLVLLWMAEGLLVQHKQNMTMEEIGGEYFDGLMARSFFQRSSKDSSSFVMHDLINDLAKFVSGDFCYRVESNNLSRMPKKIRHLSYERRSYGTSKEFNSICEAQQLRTLIPNDLVQRSGNHGISKEAIQCLLSLKRLRVFSFSEYLNVTELPELIGKLKHLRYLDLSRTNIKKLSDVVCNAYNLQTLDLEDCKNLRELPDTIVALKQLRYLNLGGTRISKLPNMICCLCHLQTLILHGCNSLLELPIGIGHLVNLCLLNLKGTNLQHMPLKFGNLTNLQTLTDFFVGNQIGSSIKELRGLHNLEGDLSIWNLQNVLDAKDALEANIKNKKYLVRLELRWGSDANGSLHDKYILEALHPHSSLQHLSITGYGGTRFPYWVGDSSFSNMVSLKLEGCKYCYELPPLGQLGLLKELRIIQFDLLIIVGPNFYGNCVSTTRKPFESLEILEFDQMSQWQTWTVKGEAFPRLQMLCINGCPNLKEALPSCFPSLTSLDIKGCTQINTPFPRAPALLSLSLEDTSRNVNFYFSDHVRRLNVLEADSLDAVLGGIEQMGVFLTNLEEIEINNCGWINHLPIESFPVLKKLYIKNSPNLKSLPSLPPSLVELLLESCQELESFPEEGLPSKLQSLEIRGCHKLIANHMQWKLQLLLSLSRLVISGEGDKEDRMESFPEETLLPSTLTDLSILYLEDLESLQCKGLQHLSSLERLRIWACPQLKSLSFKDGLLPTLTSLEIGGLDSLTSLKGIHCFTSLHELKICSCHQLENLPDEGLPCNLTSLEIRNMISLSSIMGSLKQLTSFLRLEMCNCPKLLSVPEYGLPSAITSLTICQFKNLKSLNYEGLQHFTRLEELTIQDCVELESVTEDVLPSSLVSLHVRRLDNLVTLHYKGLQHLSNLSTLVIKQCSKLQSLPEEGLPSSLSYLSIDHCPLLTKGCYWEGEDWPKISHIPIIYINGLSLK